MLWFGLFDSCLISKDYVTAIEDDWTGTPHKMPAGLSVNEFHTPQLQRPESSFFNKIQYIIIHIHLEMFTSRFVYTSLIYLYFQQNYRWVRPGKVAQMLNQHYRYYSIFKAKFQKMIQNNKLQAVDQITET